MDNKPSTALIHDIGSFKKDYISNTSSKYGFYRNYILERHLWSYEILGQLQKRGSNRCVLKGGACTQIYLPLGKQRCTADIDCLTDLSKNDLENILTSITSNLNSNKIRSSFNEYIPISGKTLPMVTFMIDLPFHYNPKKNKRNFLLKLDFLFMDINTLSKHSPANCETFGMKLNFCPLCISPVSLISNKLLTFAINSIGLELFKLDSFYKNIYDLYYLLDTFNDLDTLKSIPKYITEDIALEFSLKKLPPINLNKILNDILKTLLYFSIVDLNYEHSNPPKKLVDFEKLYLQADIKSYLDSDIWSIMSMHLYIWTKSLKKYINTNNADNFESLSSIRDEYSYFLSLTSKNKNKYNKTLKRLINNKNKSVNLSNIDNPLRLIYMNYLF